MWYVRSAPAHVHVDMLALWMRICGSMDVDVDVDGGSHADGGFVVKRKCASSAPSTHLAKVNLVSSAGKCEKQLRVSFSYLSSTSPSNNNNGGSQPTLVGCLCKMDCL